MVQRSMDSAVRTKLKQFITEELARDVGDIDVEKASLVDVGVIDSLGIMKLVEFLESEFDVVIEDDDLLPENFETLDAIQQLTESKRS